jgi:(p)ppGpp synthase/HD superfamily hydrolase
MSDLRTAVCLAFNVHEGQKDKNGEPYILHPLRVMINAGDDDDLAIIAVLHDVVEDGDLYETANDLARHGFGSHIIAAVDALTRRNGEDYFDYIRRAAANSFARMVKRADLRDNLRPGAPHLRDRYEKAIDLLFKLEEGNTDG